MINHTQNCEFFLWVRRGEKGGRDKTESGSENGSVYTVERNRSRAQVIAIAVDKNVFVGPNANIDPNTDSDTKVFDLAGKMVLPASSMPTPTHLTKRILRETSTSTGWIPSKNAKMYS